MNDRNLYLGTLALQVGIALIGVILTFLGLYPAGLGLIGLSVALTPVTGHLRMRRELAALRKTIQSSGIAAPSTSHSNDISLLSAKIDDLSESVKVWSQQNSSATAVSRSERDANTIAREVRALRLTLRESEKLNTQQLNRSIKDQNTASPNTKEK